jgi:exonuclease SbcD
MELAVPGCNENVIVYGLPYPSESRLNEILTEKLDDVSQQLAYSERVGQLFAAADYIYRPDTVNLAVAHLFAFGGVESESERQLGGALAVSPKEMPKQAQYVALGHLHRPQQIHNALQPCRYSGSPLSFSFSEADQQKEVIVVDVVPGGLARVNPIKLTSGKALKHWRANNIGEAKAWCAEPSNLQCWVELEILADCPINVSELAELRRAHSGIITIRPIFPDLDDQAVKMSQLSKMSLEERFSVFFQRERGIAPQEELVRFFLEIVNQQGIDEDLDVKSNIHPTEREVG